MDRHTHPEIASDLIDEKELARRTQLSRTTLQTMRRKGGGPPWAKLGPHRVAYRLSDVERWIEERTQRPPAAPKNDATSTLGDAP